MAGLDLPPADPRFSAGKEQPETPETKAWATAEEHDSLEDPGGDTLFRVSMDMAEDPVNDFSKTFPKAWEQVKLWRAGCKHPGGQAASELAGYATGKDCTDSKECRT